MDFDQKYCIYPYNDCQGITKLYMYYDLKTQLSTYITLHLRYLNINKMEKP